MARLSRAGGYLQSLESRHFKKVTGAHKSINGERRREESEVEGGEVDLWPPWTTLLKKKPYNGEKGMVVKTP